MKPAIKYCFYYPLHFAYNRMNKKREIMKKKILLAIVLLFAGLVIQAQDADEIISNYFENTGGLEAWKELQTMKIKATFDQGGMQLNAVIYRKEPDMSRTEIVVQGKTIVQAYDGETGWLINPMMGSEDPQKMPPEMEEAMKDEKFESELIDYNEKGNTVELEGTEEVEGTATYKVKLTKKNGDVEYYFFDTEYYVPIMERRIIKVGPMKGQESETYISDYQEVNGLMMPFFIEVKANGQSMQKLTIDEYAMNEDIEDSLFKFPGEE
jgi:outer membrane lipoprotein-sorting protein